jgi:hypothetical protein
MDAGESEPPTIDQCRETVSLICYRRTHPVLRSLQSSTMIQPPSPVGGTGIIRQPFSMSRSSSFHVAVVIGQSSNMQIAPTILKALGLDPQALNAVRREGTTILPGLGLPGFGL